MGGKGGGIPGGRTWAGGKSSQGASRAARLKFPGNARSVYQPFSESLLYARLSENGQGFKVDKIGT